MTHDAVDALYGLDPAQFVARRDALAKRVRVDGDRAGAAAIKALRRPTVGAWYANVAARAGLVSLREWLRLGERLRAAQASGDFGALRAGGAERAGLEARVLADLTAHLADLGVVATAAGLEEVRSTLRAALADEAAAEAVRAARLARPLSYAGFGEVDMTAALAALGTSASGVVEPAAAEREAAEREAAEREAAERASAERALVATRGKLRDAEASVRAAVERVAQARRALEQAERDEATASARVALLSEQVADLEHRLG